LLDHYVLALYESRLVQALEESCHDVRKRLGRCATEKSDHRHRRLLRVRRERPRRRATEQRDERAGVSFDRLVGAGEQRRRNHFGHPETLDL